MTVKIYAIEIIFKSHEPFQIYQLTGPANSASKVNFNGIQRVPALRAFWEKTMLHEIHASGTVGGPLLPQKSPT